MTREEAKEAFYDRTPVEIYVTSVGWIRHKYIDQIIYSRPDCGHANRNVPCDITVRALDMTGQAVTVCSLKRIRAVK